MLGCLVQEETLVVLARARRMHVVLSLNQGCTATQTTFLQRGCCQASLQIGTGVNLRSTEVGTVRCRFISHRSHREQIKHTLRTCPQPPRDDVPVPLQGNQNTWDERGRLDTVRQIWARRIRASGVLSVGGWCRAPVLAHSQVLAGTWNHTLGAVASADMQNLKTTV
jgi:hypothetical protein